jgi:adenylate cyclase
MARHTFLFSDLVGFTALTAARGDDDAADVALAFCGRVREMLTAHGAEEIKSMGDALMIRCDDAAAAIRLGLRIVRELEDDPGMPPVRVGMHTGPAVQREGDWYGTTVNVASRLCGAAGGGEVLVSDETRAAAGPMRKVRLGDRQLHWLKNITEPVAAYIAGEHQCVPERLRALRTLKTSQAGGMA